jgi:hypothetical protein
MLIFLIFIGHLDFKTYRRRLAPESNFFLYIDFGPIFSTKKLSIYKKVINNIYENLIAHLLVK